MDDLTRLELDTMAEQARALRLAPPDALPQGDERPLSLSIERRNAMRELLQKCPDPDAPAESDQRKQQYLKVSLVWAVHDQDERGLVEVNYLVQGEPMTAFLRGRELAYVVEGW